MLLAGGAGLAADWLVPTVLSSHVLCWLCRARCRGFVVTDCGAIESMTDGHEWAPTRSRAAAASLLAGTDLACVDYSYLR